MQLMGKLICPVILKLGTDDNDVKAKVTQLISVINQRVKAAPDLKLPTKNLLQVFREHHESPLIANVALMQLVIAIQRVPSTELRELVRNMKANSMKLKQYDQRDARCCCSLIWMRIFCLWHPSRCRQAAGNWTMLQPIEPYSDAAKLVSNCCRSDTYRQEFLKQVESTSEICCT